MQVGAVNRTFRSGAMVNAAPIEQCDDAKGGARPLAATSAADREIGTHHR